MSGNHHEVKVPRPVLIGAGVLLACVMGIAATARSARLASPPPVPESAARVELRFADADDGSVVVLSADGEHELTRLQPGEEGFVRGVLRGMNRTRRLESLPQDAPFHLIRDVEGGLSLHDPQTDQRLELRSFGRTNYESFLALLDVGQRTGAER